MCVSDGHRSQPDYRKIGDEEYVAWREKWFKETGALGARQRAPVSKEMIEAVLRRSRRMQNEAIYRYLALAFRCLGRFIKLIACASRHLFQLKWPNCRKRELISD